MSQPQSNIERVVNSLLARLTPTIVQALVADRSPVEISHMITDLILEAKRQLKARVCRPAGPDVPGQHYIMNEVGEVFTALWQPRGALWFCAEIGPEAINETELGLMGYRWLRKVEPFVRPLHPKD